jgi:tetrahydromethanopterin S-methyltransferase subunit H
LISEGISTAIVIAIKIFQAGRWGRLKILKQGLMQNRNGAPEIGEWCGGMVLCLSLLLWK